MSTEENKALVRRFQDEIRKGNLAIIDELVAPGTLLGGVSAEQWKAETLQGRKDIPDESLTIDEMIAEGDQVMFHWTFRGTHVNVVPTPYGPAQPTGKLITASGISIYRIEGGKIVSDRFVGDFLGFYTQLGVLPAPNPNS